MYRPACRLTLAVFFSLILLAPRPSLATGAAGTAAAPYLKMPMGGRPEGMGEAFTGLADDISAMYYNAAGMSQIDATNVAFMQMLGFGGINYSYLSMATPAENLGIDTWGTLGLFYELVSIENIPRTREVPGDPLQSYDQSYADLGYTYTAGGTVTGLAFAWQATKIFSIGGTFKVLNEKVDTYNSWGFATDLSLYSKPKIIPGLSAGASLQNLGQSPGAAPLPVSLRVGTAYGIDNLFSLATFPIDLLNMSVDVVLPVVPIDGSVHYDIGTEYRRYFNSQTPFTQTASIRAGYRYHAEIADEGDLGYLSGLTAGLGYSMDFNGAVVSLNYAWVPYGDLGMAHRIEVTGEFGIRPRTQITPPEVLKTPTGVQATAGDHSGQVSWKANVEPVSGYNVYLAYKATGPWYKLNSKPVTSTSQHLSLYNGVTAYLAVTSLSQKLPMKESARSLVVAVTPHAGGGQAPAPVNPSNPAPAKPAGGPAGQPVSPTAK
jgi:hypothetical protein